MRNLRYIFFAGLVLAAVFWFKAAEVGAGRTLSKEIAPDVPAETLRALVAKSPVYLTGGGDKDVLLVGDPFCANTRKAYDILLSRLEYIRTLRVLLVSRFPEKGSDLVAAFVIRMHAIGKGRATLETALKLDVPEESNRDAARKRALELLRNGFPDDFGGKDVESLQPEIDVVAENTALAHELGYRGTPHIIIGERVLHGYSRGGMDILLKSDL